MQLLQNSASIDASLSDETLIELLNQIKPAIIANANRFHLESDDLSQHVAIAIMESGHHVATSTNMRMYCIGIIRRVVAKLTMNRRSIEASLSLDEPLSDDSSNSLADIISEPALLPEDKSSIDERIGIVHAALRRLPLEEQLYLREVYALNSFNPLPPDWSRKPNYDRSRSALSLASYRRLRNDPALASALEVQA